MRAAPHADINLITLLVGATDSGLELLDRHGNWLAVESEPDEIVVDTGDMMSRLTNDMLPSTVHRVVNPNMLDRSRYSMPFFLHPHSRASCNCLRMHRSQRRQVSAHHRWRIPRPAAAGYWPDGLLNVTSAGTYQFRHLRNRHYP